MKIEVQDFYPTYVSKKEIAGTLHVYLMDENIDIRGCKYRWKGGKEFISLPHYSQIDEDGVKQTFPIIRFFDEVKHGNLMKALRESVIAFMEKKRSTLALKKSNKKIKSPRR